MTTSNTTESSTVASPRVRVRAAVSVRLLPVVLAVAAVLFGAAASVAATGDAAEWEGDVVRFVNGWPDALEPWFWTIQQAGMLAAPAIGGLLLAWRGGRWGYAVPFVVLTPLKLGIEWLVIKQLIDRGRPWETLGGDLVLRGEILENSGFPSGHATTAVAFAVLICAFLPLRWRWVPLFWALWVGIARLYFAQHNPLDLVGGFAIGTVYGVVLWMVFLNRYVGPDVDRTVAGGEGAT